MISLSLGYMTSEDDSAAMMPVRESDMYSVDVVKDLGDDLFT